MGVSAGVVSEHGLVTATLLLVDALVETLVTGMGTVMADVTWRVEVSKTVVVVVSSGAPGTAAVPEPVPGTGKETGVLADTVTTRRLPMQAAVMGKCMVK